MCISESVERIWRMAVMESGEGQVGALVALLAG